MENKKIGNQVELNVAHNSGIGAGDPQALIPEIEPIDSAAGSTSMQRMGDRIKPKSLRVGGVVCINTGANTNQQIYARVMVLAQKSIKVGSQVNGGGVAVTSLMRPGYGGVGGSEQPFSGATIEGAWEVNRDLFRVYYDKTFKLGLSIPISQQANLHQGTRWSYKFKKLPAALTFDETNGNWVNNFAPFVCIGYYYADGSAPDVVATRLITNTYATLEFEDA